jgi:hypothetical protein
MRRLKKADCEVDFFFILDEFSFYPRSRVSIVSDMPEVCQRFFKFFAEIFNAASAFYRVVTYGGSRPLSVAAPAFETDEKRLPEVTYRVPLAGRGLRRRENTSHSLNRCARNTDKTVCLWLAQR